MAEEWIPDLEAIAESLRKDAQKGMARLNDKPNWNINDQKSWGACNRAEELADQLDGLINRIRRETECKPPSALEINCLEWERKAREVILARNSTRLEMQLASWVCAMGRKIRLKDDV